MTPLNIAIATARAARRWPGQAQPPMRQPEPEQVSGLPKLSIRMVQEVVADHYAISIASMLSRNSRRQFLLPRQVAIYLSRKITRRSYPDIGRVFGRDHSMVWHSFQAIEERIKSDNALAAEVSALEAKIMDRRNVA